MLGVSLEVLLDVFPGVSLGVFRATGYLLSR
jgi:hypothetical protein